MAKKKKNTHTTYHRIRPSQNPGIIPLCPLVMQNTRKKSLCLNVMLQGSLPQPLPIVFIQNQVCWRVGLIELRQFRRGGYSYVQLSERVSKRT